MVCVSDARALLPFLISPLLRRCHFKRAKPGCCYTPHNSAYLTSADSAARAPHGARKWHCWD